MRTCLLPLLLALGVSPALPLRRADASGGVSISTFYDELSPHGDWVTVGSYGHCWRPRGIDRNWQPCRWSAPRRGRSRESASETRTRDLARTRGATPEGGASPARGETSA